MSEKLRKVLPKVKANVKLSSFTSFKIGGPAAFFYEAKTKKDLIHAVKTARKFKLPYFLLGGGTNLLVSDKGFQGLVIKVANKDLEIEGEKILVDAGVALQKIVEEAAKQGLSGLEFCVGIPGTVGGALFGNAGVRGLGIGEVIFEVEVLDREGKIKKVSQKKGAFSYRQSRFQTSGEVILKATLDLKKAPKEEIRKRMNSFLAKRQNQPREASAGSIFKNPEGDSAGRLIEACGLKGEKEGDAQVSPQHANWIVNLGHASCRDVLQLILRAKRAVFEKFGILLEEEIVFLGVKPKV